MQALWQAVDALRPDTVAAARGLLSEARGGGAAYHPSPVDWRDEVLYFLLPDRFSDGREGERPVLTREDVRALRQAAGRPDWHWQRWAESGKRWQGGTIKGIAGRLDYLERLGVTALWIGPVFRQRVRLDTYHGYGIADFLDVDARFGTRRDLLELVQAAHERDMRVVLDIIVNHSGDNWGYVPPSASLSEARNEPPYRPWPDYYGNPADEGARRWRLAWRDAHQGAFTVDAADLAGPEAGVWPRELQSPQAYARAGRGDLGAGALDDPHAEHKRTDFFALKDFALDVGDTLSLLAEVYKHWVAITDCDGFRIDTVKHMSLEESRNFCGAIREFADLLGKRNFLLVGEIAGGDDAQDYVLDNLAVLRRNLSAALDIGSARQHLASAAKGLAPGTAYLEAFDEASEGFGSHRALGDRHLSILDDHDHVVGPKVRFSAEIPDDSPVKDHQIAVATAFQLFTLGVPCLYYGSEQALAGPAHSQLGFLAGEGYNDPGNYGDRYLREAMFGPEHPRAAHTADLATQVGEVDETLPGFGPFGTAGRHAFDESSPSYTRIAALCAVRSAHPVLRIGRQYPRQTRTGGPGFALPPAGELVAWSRLLDVEEAVVVVNPNGGASRSADVVVSAEVSAPPAAFRVAASTAEAGAAPGGPGAHPVGSRLPVRGGHGEAAYVEVRDLPPAEVLVLVRDRGA